MLGRSDAHRRDTPRDLVKRGEAMTATIARVGRELGRNALQRTALATRVNWIRTSLPHPQIRQPVAHRRVLPRLRHTPSRPISMPHTPAAPAPSAAATGITNAIRNRLHKLHDALARLGQRLGGHA